MSSGRQILAEIERALTQSRGEFRQLDVELQSASASLARHRRREAALYQRLAVQRLDTLTASDLSGQLDTADRRAGELLVQRERELDALQQRIVDVEAAMQTLQQEREQAADALETAETALETRLAEVDAELERDDDYQRLVETAQQALDTAAAAAEKTDDANVRREEKRVPFEADPLFMYLWQRGYGTARYRANPFTRMLDRATARHIRFEHARRNYYLLNEIPRRLAQHAEALEDKAADAATAVADYERERDLAAGAEPLETAVEHAGEALEAKDAEIEERQREYAGHVAARDDYANGRDPLFTQAMQLLAEQFKAEPIPQLRRQAAETLTPEDDRWVDELAEIREQQERLSRYLDDQRGLHARHADRVNELAALRSRYKSRNFDAGNSIIDDQASVSLMIHELLRGLVNGDQLWRRIKRAQHFRRQRRVGRVRHGGMGGMRIPRMPRGVRMPRSMGRGGGGGGFRTKGGF